MARGNITFDIIGGTQPYRVLLRNNAKPEEAYGGYFESSGSNKEIEIAEDASSGLYYLDVIDNNGCVVTSESIEIELIQIATVTFNSTEIFTLGINGGQHDSSDDGLGTHFVSLELPYGSYGWTANIGESGYSSGTVIVADSSVTVYLANQTPTVTFTTNEEFILKISGEEYNSNDDGLGSHFVSLELPYDSYSWTAERPIITKPGDSVLGSLDVEPVTVSFVFDGDGV